MTYTAQGHTTIRRARNGKGIAAMLSLFAISDKRKVSAYGDISGWTETLPTATEQQPYLWQVVKTTYSTGDEEYSTPVLMATFSAAANANLLENASFVSSKRMSAWQTQSVYQAVTGQEDNLPDTTKDGHGILTSEQVEGRNSYYDVCEATSDIVQYKNVLQQQVATSKLTKGAWHTLSFWAKKGNIFTGNVGTGGVSYTVSLTAGTKYTFTMTGKRSAYAQKNNSTLNLTLSTTSGLVQGSASITSTAGQTVSLSFTPTADGDYVLAVGMSGSAEISTGTVTELWMSPEQDLQTYLYSKAIVDTTAKIYMDGVELAPNTDLGLTWSLSTSWTKHTLTFKTKSSLTGNTNVLFRLPPCLATDASRKVWLCMPKLETGFFATAFVDTAADAKGEDGDAGIAGQIVRTSEWTAGGDYHNDTVPTDDGIRYLDVVVSGSGTSRKIYQCKQTHQDATVELTNATYWKQMNDMAPIYTPLIMAENGVLTVMQSNRIAIMSTDGTAVQGCLTGVSNNTDYMMWIGGTAASEAKFKVKYDGTMEATGCNVNGSGTFSGAVKAKSIGYEMVSVNISSDDSAEKYTDVEGDRGYALDADYSVFSIGATNVAANSQNWLLGLPYPREAKGSVVEIFTTSSKPSGVLNAAKLRVTCYGYATDKATTKTWADRNGTEELFYWKNKGNNVQASIDLYLGWTATDTSGLYVSWIRLFCDGNVWRVVQYEE